MRDAPLFRGGDLGEFLDSRRQAALSKVVSVPAEEVRFSPEAVAERLVEEFRVEQVSLDFEHVTRTEPHETTLSRMSFGEIHTVAGQSLSIVVPMVGDSELLRRRASTYSVEPAPEAFLRGDALVFSVSGPRLTSQQVVSAISRMKEKLTTMIGWANRDVVAWEPHLRATVSTAVNQRRERLEHAASLSADLDIPLAATASSRQVHVPVTRKFVRVEHPAGQPSGQQPRLAEAVYEDVLRTICGLARAMERLPRTAARFREDELRDLVLFILNANYEGAARGEVFNGHGKTDLLLPWGKHNAFIGECKIWRGPKKFTEAIDQLLGYTVWQDTKAALILFIRGGEATKVISAADVAIRSHSCWRSAAHAAEPEVRRDHLMTSMEDPQRSIRVAFLPVIVPNAGDPS